MNEFGQSRRLLKKTDYEFVFEQAKKIATPYFIILYRDNGLSHARLGLALSKKAIAKAHDRNRIKRLLRETFRLNHSMSCVDIIVLAKRGMNVVENALLMDKFRQAWGSL